MMVERRRGVAGCLGAALLMIMTVSIPMPAQQMVTETRDAAQTQDEDAHRNPSASYLFLVECGMDVTVYAPGFHDKNMLYALGSHIASLQGQNRS